MTIKFTIVAMVLLPAALLAQEKATVGNTMADIATQPAQDINVKKKAIPAVLVAAKEDPYTSAGAANCAQIGRSIASLSAVLGQDFDSKEEKRINRGKQAASVGKAVVQSLIPFRGIIREVSGAASAQREYDAAVDAGIARRGFLRGLGRTKGCKIAS